MIYIGEYPDWHFTVELTYRLTEKKFAGFVWVNSTPVRILKAVCRCGKCTLVAIAEDIAEAWAVLRGQIQMHEIGVL